MTSRSIAVLEAIRDYLEDSIDEDKDCMPCQATVLLRDLEGVLPQIRRAVESMEDADAERKEPPCSPPA